jgi:4-hydroxy-3-polyprenylbenzoate decarboxylase
MVEHSMNKIRWIIGISGASGTVYARRLLDVVSEKYPEIELHVVISEGAFRVFREEDGINLSERNPDATSLLGREAPSIIFHSNKDTGACIASGSFVTAGMVIIPCSMNTLGALAHGLADNLLRRAADVTMKENKPLLIVPRETPLSTIHLENMLKLSKNGARIIPAMPGFYHKPTTINELTDMLVMKVLDQMQIHSNLAKRWKDD